VVAGTTAAPGSRKGYKQDCDCKEQF